MKKEYVMFVLLLVCFLVAMPVTAVDLALANDIPVVGSTEETKIMSGEFQSVSDFSGGGVIVLSADIIHTEVSTYNIILEKDAVEEGYEFVIKKISRRLPVIRGSP